MKITWATWQKPLVWVLLDPQPMAKLNTKWYKWSCLSAMHVSNLETWIMYSQNRVMPLLQSYKQGDTPSLKTFFYLHKTPVATLPGAWHYRVSAETGWPSVSILWLGEMESSICNFSVWQHVKLSEQICPWDTLACCWDVKQPTKQSNKPSWKPVSAFPTQ